MENVLGNCNCGREATHAVHYIGLCDDCNRDAIRRREICENCTITTDDVECYRREDCPHNE